MGGVVGVQMGLGVGYGGEILGQRAVTPSRESERNTMHK